MNTIELTNELKSLNRQIDKLKRSKPVDPRTPAQLIDHARIEAETKAISKKRTAIGTELLKEAEAGEKRKAKHLQKIAADMERNAADLLEQLPLWAEKVLITFKGLGKEYDQLLKISHSILRMNNALMCTSIQSPVKAVLKIEPANLNLILKQQFRESFGNTASDVHLQLKTDEFDIQDAVADIKNQCTSR